MQPSASAGALGSPPAPKHPIAFIFHWVFKVRVCSACRTASARRRASPRAAARRRAPPRFSSHRLASRRSHAHNPPPNPTQPTTDRRHRLLHPLRGPQPQLLRHELRRLRRPPRRRLLDDEKRNGPPARRPALVERCFSRRQRIRVALRIFRRGTTNHRPAREPRVLGWGLCRPCSLGDRGIGCADRSRLGLLVDSRDRSGARREQPRGVLQVFE